MVHVAAGFDQCPVTRDTWDEAVGRLGGPVYMTFDWLQTWWEFYGQDKQLRLFLFSQQDELVALLPLYLETFGVGPGTVRVARLVGANVPPKTFNPPVDSASAPQVFVQVLNRLFGEDRCDLLSFGPVSKAWPGAAGLEAACGIARDRVSPASYHARDVQTLFHLPATFEQYLSSRPGSQRSELKRRLRQLEKVGVVTTEIVNDPARLEAEFESFLNHHAEQWRAVRLGGHFTAWPRGEEFHRALVRNQGRLGRVQFHRILVDGKLIANRYTYLWGNTLFSELPSRAVGAPWDKLGLGGTAYLKMFEAATAAGIPRIDSGMGRYDNKVQLGGEEVEVGIWRVAGQGFSGVKARLFLRVARAVHAVCHKVWYRRVLPKLPACFKRTQAAWWLRFDA